MKRALILVDIQNDFMPGGALAVGEGDAVIPVANTLQGRFDVVVATQDWHPPGHASFASAHEGKAPGELIDLDGLEQVLWPDHCVQGTRGAAFVDGLQLHGVSGIFRKGMSPRIDSYSGFYDNGRRQSTGMAGYLRDRGVERVYVMGVATDYCVAFTALDARREGFEVILVEDGCRGVELSPGDGARAVDRMREAGVRLTTSAAILGASSSGAP